MTTEATMWSNRARDWLNATPPPDGAPAGTRSPRNDEEHREWLDWGKKLHAAGLVTLGWPAEHGGADASADDVLMVRRVLAIGGAPNPLTEVGVNLVAPALFASGTEEQRAEHLPGIADGSVVWVQLFSEPGAGSDLASLRTKARRREDGMWSITGQKVWSTHAQIADWGFLLARTGELADRHRALTAFLVPMHSEGVEVRPIREMTGTADFNEVFFDDLKLDDRYRVGEVDGGWSVAMNLLADERAVFGGLIEGLEAEVYRMLSLRSALPERAVEDYLVPLGSVLAEISALRLILMNPDRRSGEESVLKIRFSELNIVVHQTAVDLGAEHPDLVPAEWIERWNDNYLYTRAYTISSGANEVLRNVIAKRVLGMINV